MISECPASRTKRIASDGRFLQHLPAGAGQELAAGPGGDVYLFDMPPSGRTNLRRLRSDGSFDWMKANDRLGGSGVAGASGRVYATEALSCTVAVYDLRPGNDAPVARLALIEALYAWPFDLAMTPTGHLAAAGGEGRAVTVLDPASGRSVAEMRAEDGGGVERVAVGADGTTFALLFDGSVVAYRSLRHQDNNRLSPVTEPGFSPPKPWNERRRRPKRRIQCLPEGRRLPLPPGLPPG